MTAWVKVWQRDINWLILTLQLRFLALLLPNMIYSCLAEGQNLIPRSRSAGGNIWFLWHSSLTIHTYASEMKHFFMSTWVTGEASSKTSVLECDTVPEPSLRMAVSLHVTGRGEGDPGSRQCKWNFPLFCLRAFLVTRSWCIRKPLYLKEPTLFFCPLSWHYFIESQLLVRYIVMGHN